MTYLACSVQEDSPRSVTEIKLSCSSQKMALVPSRTSASDAAACSVSQLSAKVLAERGLHVLLVERHKLPRYKSCSGVLIQKW